MNKIEDGGPAFPSEQSETQDGTWNQTYDPGMSLRDWFAGQALADLASLTESNSDIAIAKTAYRIADAMIAARKGGAS